MARRRGHTVSTLISRTEHVHLDGTGEVEVEYEITGSMSPYRPATYNDPAEGGEVEIETVTCYHPRLPTHKSGLDIPLDDCPFDDAEWKDIQERLESEEVFPDDYDDPPERDFDD